ncbi:hypothetical protein GALMADRAFT_161633 [Galerina marginata CBS 339.88]|uniref:DUF6533 domain-containing protein n=1 Tax=Galerina marginata (strain CBS 339.88) TaxID=685588 RepID=A0A067S8Z7_GALM3|nr:hypothetical protein GALMADRAFT_161633 [Galerina marginata CBS 339.88]
MTPPPPSPGFLLEGMSETQLTSYVWVSGLTVIVYDTISTLPREMTYIWSGRWSLPTGLYLVLRYWGLAQTLLNTIVYSTVQTSVTRFVVLNTKFTSRLFTVSPGHSGVTFSSALLCPLVQIRFYWALSTASSAFVYTPSTDAALMARLRQVLFMPSSQSDALIYLTLKVQLYFAVKIGKSTVKGTFAAPSGLRILGCLTGPVDLSGITTMWTVSIIVSVICFTMTLAQFIHNAREARRAGGRYRVSPLAGAFIRDGTVYFLAVVVTLIGGVITGELVSGPLTILYEPWMAISLIVAGSRLVLNLREAAACDVSPTRIPSSIRGLETFSSTGIAFVN